MSPVFAPLSRFVLILVLGLALTGCETAEDRAEGHYQSALELVAKNDVDRALVELRNVFKLKGNHRDARALYARLSRENGQPKEAFSQYLRLVEQYPEDLEGRLALGEMAIRRLDWETAERHVLKAFELAPEDPLAQTMHVALQYRTARKDEDDKAAALARTEANKLLAAHPEFLIARDIEIDALMNASKLSSALEQIDIALAQEPANMIYHESKLQVLRALEDVDGIGRHLEAIHSQFPENENVRRLLISWYIQQGDMPKAEAFLRNLVTLATPENKPQAQMSVVEFLRQTKSPEEALGELNRLIATGENTTRFEGVKNVILYDMGQQDEAIAGLETLLSTADPSPELNDAAVTLAQMLERGGDLVGARSRVEKALQADPTHPGGLKMRGRWLIEEDKTGDAIAALRGALEKNPRDTEALVLMANAHLRDGNRQLAGERLALAVEASGQAARESLTYAQFLVQDEKLELAERVLVSALRRAPREPSLLQALGQIYLVQQDQPRLDGVIATLRQLDGEVAQSAASALEASSLLQRENVDEGLGVIQQMIADGTARKGAAALVIQNHLRNNDPDQARAYLDQLLSEDPTSFELRFLDATLHLSMNDMAQAEAKYRALLDETPGEPQVIVAMTQLLSRSGRNDEIAPLLETAIADSNRAPRLLLMQASFLEQARDFDGAIAVYEELYAGDTSNTVVANNLASLLTSHRDDEEGLKRAFTIAKRLRNTQVPAFQDTYGWVEYRRGNYETAVEYLEPAAQGLPNDPLVQIHLGLAYAKAEQYAKARATLTAALDLVGERPIPQAVEARQVLEALPQSETE